MYIANKHFVSYKYRFSTDSSCHITNLYRSNGPVSGILFSYSVCHDTCFFCAVYRFYRLVFTYSINDLFIAQNWSEFSEGLTLWMDAISQLVIALAQCYCTPWGSLCWHKQMHIYIIYAHTHAKDYTEKDIREVATMYLLDGSHSWLVFFN